MSKFDFNKMDSSVRAACVDAARDIVCYSEYAKQRLIAEGRLTRSQERRKFVKVPIDVYWRHIDIFENDNYLSTLNIMMLPYNIEVKFRAMKNNKGMMYLYVSLRKYDEPALIPAVIA